jgi:Tfp pilus assembly protein PilF
MSLLLDALKTNESIAPLSAEVTEEALDARDALKILTAKMPVRSALTLESSPADVPAMDTDTAPDIIPRESAAASRNPPIGRSASASRSGLPPTLSPTTRPSLRYAAMLAAAVAVVIVVMVGKSLLHKASNPIIYPEAAASQPADAGRPSPVSDPPAVQVPSRPASQFSALAGAPEIELRENSTPPTAMRTTSPRADRARPDMSAPDVGQEHLSMPQRSFSVSPSAGVASIDAHIERAYKALGSGDIASAQREYRSALELDPNNVDALLGTASAASRSGNSTLAAAAYLNVLRLEPGNQNATAALSILNQDPTTIEANESRLKVMIAGDNERRPALHAALAGVYAADRRWADSAQEYFIALSMDPENAELAFNLAASLDQNHNRAAALTYYTQALAFAKLRAAQIDVPAIEKRVSQLQVRTQMRPATPQAAP